jgi:tetratricopeptide (TPR) repeat protein
VTIDRDETLRHAEMLLRQGQVEAAVSEYRALADAHPADFALLNTVGDALVRAGAPDRALPFYAQAADGYLEEGFYARAIGFYKKLLKFAPDHEDTLLKLAKASANQGLRADARRYLETVAQARQRRGDRAGTAIVLCSLDDLDAADFAARLAAVRALVPLQPDQAVARLNRIATDLQARDRRDQAWGVWREAYALDPSDTTARGHLAAEALAAGAFGETVALLGTAASLDSRDFELLAEARFRLADASGVRTTLHTWLQRYPDARAAVHALAGRVADLGSDAVYACVEAVVETALARGETEAAEAVLREFVARHPAHVAAAALRVKIATRQGSAEQLADAQAVLAETYLLAHEPEQAALLAAALCEQYPEEPRYRRCLAEAEALLGQGRAGDEPASAESVPFVEMQEPRGTVAEVHREALEPGDMSSRGSTPLVPLEVVPILDDELLVDVDPLPLLDEELLGVASHDESRDTSPADAPVEIAGDRHVRSEVATDVTPARDAPGPDRRVRQIVVEVDLTDRLDEPSAVGAAPQAPAGAATTGSSSTQTLESTFADLRSHGTASGEDLVSLGRTYVSAGLPDQAIEAFVAAAHDETQRYAASVALVEIFDARHDTPSAIEWLERVAEAAPTAAKRGAALYRLGCLLDETGEVGRALAVFLELHAMAPTFRDVRARIARLEVAQGGGGSSAP